jgi:endonuclease-3
MVTPALFAAYPDARALAAARVEDVEELVRTTGFFRSKAKNLSAWRARSSSGTAARCRPTWTRSSSPRRGAQDGERGLGNAFDTNVGVTVDTHVARVSRRLGLTRHDDPVAIERDLMPLFPQPGWALLSHRLIFHGRRVCDARRPRCGACVLADVCPSAGVAGPAADAAGAA